MATYSPSRLQACLDQNPPPPVLPLLTISSLDLSNADLSAMLTPVKGSPRKLLVPSAPCMLTSAFKEERWDEAGVASTADDLQLQQQPQQLPQQPQQQQHQQQQQQQFPSLDHKIHALAADPDPLQHSLQTAILADCRQTSLPFTLFCPPPVPSDPAALPTRQASLEAQFLAVQSHVDVSKQHLEELMTFYRHQRASIETQRLSSVHFTAPTTPWLLPTVQGYFDHHQLQLISRVEASLAFLHAQCLQQRQHHRRQGQRPMPASSRVKARRGTPLSATAVKIMTKWYEQNLSHPYPSREASEVMASAGGLTVEQVRKWFCNKRKRSGNTKTLGQIAASRHRGRHLTAETLLLTGARKGLD